MCIRDRKRTVPSMKLGSSTSTSLTNTAEPKSSVSICICRSLSPAILSRISESRRSSNSESTLNRIPISVSTAASTYALVAASAGSTGFATFIIRSPLKSTFSVGAPILLRVTSAFSLTCVTSPSTILSLVTALVASWAVSTAASATVRTISSVSYTHLTLPTILRV